VRVRLNLKPGQRGTRRLVAEYGDRLVCVRYRYDIRTRRRYKTVELIIDERDWDPPGATLFLVRINWGEIEFARAARKAGGVWLAQRKLWRLRYDAIRRIGLEARIVDTEDAQ
jgi:hypothetical protein